MEKIQSYSNAGYKFEVLKRENETALSMGKNVHGSVIYEVFKVKIQKESISIFAGVEVKFEAKETKPKDSDFGKDAFSYSDYNLALKKFNELQNT